MNWIKEKWLPIVVEFKGSVKNDKLPRSYQGRKDSMKDKIFSKIDSTQTIIKLETDVSGKDFIKYGKLNLKFNRVQVKEPLFIFWEFDDFQPWLINPDENNEYKTSFMVPPGTWKVFFTTQLG